MKKALWILLFVIAMPVFSQDGTNWENTTFEVPFYQWAEVWLNHELGHWDSLLRNWDFGMIHSSVIPESTIRMNGSKFESIDISILLSGNPKTNEGSYLALEALKELQSIVDSWESAGYPVSKSDVRVTVSSRVLNGNYPEVSVVTIDEAIAFLR